MIGQVLCPRGGTVTDNLAGPHGIGQGHFPKGKRGAE